MSDPTLPACEPNPTSMLLKSPACSWPRASSFGALESLVECADPSRPYLSGISIYWASPVYHINHIRIREA